MPGASPRVRELVDRLAQQIDNVANARELTPAEKTASATSAARSAAAELDGWLKFRDGALEAAFSAAERADRAGRNRLASLSVVEVALAQQLAERIRARQAAVDLSVAAETGDMVAIAAAALTGQKQAAFAAAAFVGDPGQVKALDAARERLADLESAQRAKQGVDELIAAGSAMLERADASRDLVAASNGADNLPMPQGWYGAVPPSVPGYLRASVGLPAAPSAVSEATQ